MVPFAGYSMPVLYSSTGTISASHLFTRSSGSLFDVSHMLQTRITGKEREEFMSLLTVADLKSAAIGSAQLTVFTNEAGGILDDAILTKFEDHLFLVSNAGCADKIKSHLLKMAEQKSADVAFEFLSDEKRGLLALQGPESAAVLSRLSGQNLDDLMFMNSRKMMVDRVECLVSRCGYTGEDGFEVRIDCALTKEDISKCWLDFYSE